MKLKKHLRIFYLIFYVINFCENRKGTRVVKNESRLGINVFVQRESLSEIDLFLKLEPNGQ